MLLASPAALAMSITGPRLDPRYVRLDALDPQNLLQGTGLEGLVTSDIWVEDNVPMLNKGGDFDLTCDQQGHYTLTMDPGVYEAGTVAREVLNTPLWVDHAFSSGCPALNGQSFLGPLETLPADIKQYASTDPIASAVVIKPLYIESSRSGNITFSAALGDYHDIMGTFSTNDEPSTQFLQPGARFGGPQSAGGHMEKKSIILASTGIAIGLTNLGCRIANGCCARC